MKKVLLSLLIGGALFAQNLLQNPGFENWTDGVLQNWSHDNGITVEQCSVADSVHGGTYSARVILTTQSQNNADFYSDEVSVTAGVQYEISFWVFDNDPAGRARLVVWWYDSDHSYLSGDYSEFSTDNTEWQQIVDTLTAPENAAYAKLDIRFYDVSGNWDGDALFYIDDAFFGLPSGNQPPTFSNISHSPQNPTSSDDVTVTVDINDPDGDSIAKDSLYYSLDNGNTWEDPIAHSNVSGKTYTYIIPHQPNGTTVQYYIMAEDDQGNRNTSNTFSYTVSDNPVISKVSHTPSSPTSSDVVIVAADITDPNNDLSTDSLYYSVDNGSSWTPVYRDSVAGSLTHYYTIPAQSDGTTVQYFVVAIDAQNNRTVSDTFTYTVSDLIPPVINEIMYNPRPNDSYFEYVEIYNPNDQEYDVGDWVLTGSITNDFVIPTGTTIPAYGFLVICRDTDSLKAHYGQANLGFLGDGDDIIVGNGTFNLGNGGDDVKLNNKDGVTVDEVIYDDGNGWPTAPDGDGPSLGLKNPELDNADPDSWCSEAGLDTAYGGTPGAANSCGNTVLNPGFESWTGGNPDHWYLESNATCTQEETHKHRGSYSAKLSVSSDGESMYQNIEQVIGGKPYHLHAWVYALGEVGGHPSIGIVIKYYNDDWNYIGEEGPFYPHTTNHWAVISRRGTINPDATKIRIYIVGYSTTKGDAGYVDDVNFVSEGAVATGVSETPIYTKNALQILSSLSNIKFIIHSNEPVELNIYNIAGQRMMKLNFRKETVISTLRMPRGVYFAVVKKSGRIIGHGKFVVIR